MITATKLRNGATFVDNNEPYRVVKYTHTHLSRGAGTVKLKVRNLRNGAVTTKTFRGGDRVEEVSVVRRTMQYLYTDGDEVLFMNQTDFSQMEVPKSLVADELVYMKEGSEYPVIYWDDPKTGEEEVLGVELPMKMNLTVTEAAPGVRGDTQGATVKEAVLENGIRVKVPLFIKKGDVVRVDTRDGSYVERADKN